MSHVLDFVPIWTVILGIGVFFYVLLDGFDLGVGILYGFAPDTRSAQPDDELDRADLGRQRDLAGAGRRRPAGGLPAGLRHHHAGGLFPDPDHAAGAGVPRRGVRVPLPRRRAHARFWDHAFCYGSAVATFAQGVVLGAFIQGFEVDGPAFRRRLASIASRRSRCSPAWRCCSARPARRRLADPEDRGRAAGLGAPPGPRLLARRAGRRSASSACGRRSMDPDDRARAGSPGPTSLFLAPVPIADRG